MVGSSILSTLAVAASALLMAAPSSTYAQKKFEYGTPNPNAPGVKGTNKNGPTNPTTASLGTPINQQSMARLASLNSITDWCTFGPSEPNSIVGNVEAEVVAWCIKARNNARVIPDGTVTGAHFVKTPLYVQLMATGDFTRINVAAGDEGGELDPHGATEMGNPIGGNVTSNVSGQDVFYEEWMNYISYNQICFRICIAGTDVAPTPLECQHTLDVMGCNFVMPGNYNDGVFETCDGDSAYPPGLYPQSDGSTSTFQQYFSGVYTGGDGQTTPYQNGSPDQVTPTVAFSIPSTSNCVTTNTIGNGNSVALPSVITSSIATSSSVTPSVSSLPSGSGSRLSSARLSSATGSSARPSASASSRPNGASPTQPRVEIATVLTVVASFAAAVLAGAILI